MAKGNKKSGHGMVVGGVKGTSKHLFGGDKGVTGPDASHHTMGTGRGVGMRMTHKAHTFTKKHRITTKGHPDK